MHGESFDSLLPQTNRFSANIKSITELHPSLVGRESCLVPLLKGYHSTKSQRVHISSHCHAPPGISNFSSSHIYWTARYRHFSQLWKKRWSLLVRSLSRGSEKHRRLLQYNIRTRIKGHIDAWKPTDQRGFPAGIRSKHTLEECIELARQKNYRRYSTQEGQ